MTEITTTRANPMIDPLMHIWGWEIPVYLFLGGLVAGLMILSGYFLLSGRGASPRCACFVVPGLALALLSIGMFALFLDLEHKLYFWRLYTTFQIRSPMSWGAWILLLVYPALIVNLLMRPSRLLARRFPAVNRWIERWSRRSMVVRAVGSANLGLGVMLGIYTGILLSALGARPVWNSALLGPLFLVSGLSTAAALVHMIAPDRQERELLARADNRFLAVELGTLLLFLIGLMTSTRVHREAASLFLGGPYTASFWVFVVGIGILVPLVLQSLAVSHRIRHSPIPPLLVLVGGLLLRFVIVNAGQASSWGPGIG